MIPRIMPFSDSVYRQQIVRPAFACRLGALCSARSERFVLFRIRHCDLMMNNELVRQTVSYCLSSNQFLTAYGGRHLRLARLCGTLLMQAIYFDIPVFISMLSGCPVAFFALSLRFAGFHAGNLFVCYGLTWAFLYLLSADLASWFLVGMWKPIFAPKSLKRKLAAPEQEHSSKPVASSEVVSALVNDFALYKREHGIYPGSYANEGAAGKALLKRRNHL